VFVVNLVSQTNERPIWIWDHFLLGLLPLLALYFSFIGLTLEEERAAQSDRDHGIEIMSVKGGETSLKRVTVEVCLKNASMTPITITALEIYLDNSDSSKNSNEYIYIRADETKDFCGERLPKVLQPKSGVWCITPEYIIAAEANNRIPENLNHYELEVFRKGTTEQLISKGPIELYDWNWYIA